MPQLDKFGFSAVIVWLIFGLILIYVFVVIAGLPRIYKVLLYRKKKLEYFSIHKDQVEIENFVSDKSIFRTLVNLNKVFKTLVHNSLFVTEINLDMGKSVFSMGPTLMKHFSVYGIIMDDYEISTRVTGNDV